MNFLTNPATKTLLALSILIGGASAFAGASMTGFQMQHCTTTQKCLSLKGAKADQSLLMKMWVVKKSDIEISDSSKKAHVHSWKNKTVYFDESNKELTIKDVANGKEWLVNLDTLDVIEYKL